ncbi:hypothetical protein ACH5RR_015262 [Cinchona calisaya]|uniref:Uncharacterized protein n=1 Tax=Cinchona calisaya TaxID=153742 RepID=A0ABD2ZTU7_9GENT
MSGIKFTIGLVLWKKRGPTRNLSVSKKSTTQGTLTIKVNEHINRTVGKDAQHLITECRCVVQKISKLNVVKWSNLVVEHRNNLYNSVMDEFEPVESENSKIVVHKEINSQYQNYRYRLHKIFLKYDTKEEAKRKEGVELSEIDLYEFSRHSKKKGELVNDKAKETLEKMKELKATTSMTTKEICKKEVGYIPGQVRARSASKKQTDEIVERLRTEIEENRRKADTTKQRAAAIYKQFKNLEEQQKETKELYQQLLAKMNELSK